jgi:hypothetical protein
VDSRSVIKLRRRRGAVRPIGTGPSVGCWLEVAEPNGVICSAAERDLPCRVRSSPTADVRFGQGKQHAVCDPVCGSIPIITTATCPRSPFPAQLADSRGGIPDFRSCGVRASHLPAGAGRHDSWAAQISVA